MKQGSLITLSIFLFFCFNVKLFACDSRMTGYFTRGDDNTAHAGSYWFQHLTISCKNNIYTATLSCGGEDPIEKTAYDGRKYNELKPYRHKAKVKVTVTNDNFSLSFTDKTKKICHIAEDIKGIYRKFSKGEDLLPDESSVCEAFTKQ